MKREAEDVDDLINSGICTWGSLSKKKEDKVSKRLMDQLLQSNRLSYY